MEDKHPYWSHLGRVPTSLLRQMLDFTVDPSTLVARMFALQVLQSPQISGVAFELPFCKVEPGNFADVGTAILLGSISTGIMNQGDPDFEHAHAMYVPGDDVLKIAEGDWNKRHRYRTAVVHESVHAHHDMTGRADLLVVETEQASYIAETVYTRRWDRYSKSTIRPQFLADQDNADYNAIFGPAWQLALKIVDAETTTIAASDADLKALEQAIRVSDLYKNTWNQKITANGLRW